VIQTGLYVSIMGPSFVYIRFRCGRCRRVGEQLVQQSEWDPSVLQQGEVRPAEGELQRFQALGEVTADEVIQFHYALKGLRAEPEEEARQP
jgi:hypothetical protein